ncbi:MULTISPECIES: F0F1 ATP synthase subunit B [Pseudoalteromonas]|uniref:ATP synthase subunit b n=3 Tax=Pseudoalteromonas luteoviolacea TaxID=43657 RepID=A0A166YAK3_9GAMM|nr:MULTISPECIES: F0F1 ATP synthase subunit B [Pseudoalteromonas]KZN35963.1 F0F1 ATP synthase subunit B [Pseudoalteromonas luteoviolacea S2607]KZN42064.1 F0F1 ATP synthase subunit B [Pseudoalteromonas luteoviolacea DSM 6061]KZN57052.1 F0F1 ATP synthase subunit B [Pseudoalteromonas luteoviolacea CPMOR-2]KZN60408.1 F0F1 ATP synthase subunit B [Pseudoalteromonas luteoviolacea S4060-1]MBE0387843.1 F-type H+-transporting ATPase subunit b [Pseudoalteromonas luteoviolacea DSM 6061]
MNLNATLLGELIAFVVFVLFCMKYVWPPLNGAIEARQKKIEDGLAASDEAEKELERVRKEAAVELNEAKSQAAEIIEQAKKRAALIVDEETTRGQQEREKIIAQGHSEIDSERNRVKEELRSQVATLAVVGAEKILEREINQDAHSDIVDKLVAEL